MELLKGYRTVWRYYMVGEGLQGCLGYHGTGEGLQGCLGYDGDAEGLQGCLEVPWGY